MDQTTKSDFAARLEAVLDGGCTQGEQIERECFMVMARFRNAGQSIVIFKVGSSGLCQ